MQNLPTWSNKNRSHQLTVSGQTGKDDHNALLVGTQYSVLGRPLLAVLHLYHAGRLCQTRWAKGKREKNVLTINQRLRLSKLRPESLYGSFDGM